MEHPAATEEVIRLIPSMAGKDPADVLLKRAMEKRWAPAQLHKVAQVYNTCSTLHAQQVDRNSLPELVDAPALVQRYVDTSGRSMLKAASSFMSDSPPQDAPPLEKAASAAPEPDPEVPFMWSDAPEEKVASAPEPNAYDNRAMVMDGFVANAKRVIKSAEAIAHAGGDYNRSLRKCANAVRDLGLHQGRVDVLIDLERDARSTRETPLVENAFRLFEGFAKSAGIPCERFDPNRHQDRVIGKDSTGLLQFVDDIHGSFVKYASAISDFGGHLEELLDRVPGIPADGDAKAGRWMDKVKEASAEVECLFKMAEAAPRQEAERTGNPTKKRVVSRDSIRDAMNDTSDKVHRTVYVDREGGDPEEARRAEREARDAIISLPGEVVGAVAAKTRDTVVPPVRILHGMAAPDGALAKFIAPAGDRSAREHAALQSGLDTNGLDISSMLNLKELLITDEVLSEADPAQVVEAYNAIRYASPEVAANKSMLRLQLRQAVQHQGYDIDSATASRKFENEGRKGGENRKPDKANA